MNDFSPSKTRQTRYRSQTGARLGLKTQLILVLLLVSVTGLVVVGLVASRTIETQFKKIIAKNAQNIALALSENPEIQKALAKGADQGIIQEIAEKTRRKTGVKSIVVYGNDGTIYSHPITYRLGETLVDEESKTVPVSGIWGARQVEGLPGTSIRAEAPVLFEGEPVGSIYVDVLVNEITSTKFSLYGKLMLALFTGLSVSVVAAVVLMSLTAADAERMHLERRPLRRQRRADLEHVRAEDFHAGWVKMVGVILHETGSTDQSGIHGLHGSQQSRRLPAPPHRHRGPSLLPGRLGRLCPGYRMVTGS